MLDRIIRFSLDNRLLVIVAALIVMAAGIFTARRTEVDVFPDLNAPTVVIMTEAGGMAPDEVEKLVTFPIETAMNGASGVRRVRSQSSTGFSVVWVEFDWNTEILPDRQIVAERLAAVSGQLPPNVGQPTLGPQSSILGELMIVSLTSDSVPMLELRTLAEQTVRPRLLSVGGVSQVSVIGGDLKQYQILLDPLRMRHFNVSLSEVLAATRGIGTNASGGILYHHGNEYIVRGEAGPDIIGELSRAVVRMAGEYPVQLADIAEIKVGPQSPRLGTASERCHPAVLLTVTKQSGAGTLQVTGDVDRTIAEISRTLPPGISISTDVFRQSRFIESSISNVRSSLIEGAVFVVIILFLFLANVRTTIISLVTIPVSLLVALIVMNLMGMTINTMSLGGMAIAIGSLVDDAIVDVENVWKRLRENHRLPPQDRKHALRVVFEASREVRLPILNSTLIIIVSFIPLFFLSGMEGRMLVPLGVAFIVSLVASTIVALTLTPVLCSYMLAGRHYADAMPAESPLTRWIKRGYSVALRWILRHKGGVVAATVALFLISLGLFFTLGHSFLPSFNEGSLTINVSTLPGVSLDESDEIGMQAEKLLLTVPEIRTVARKTGRAELDEHALGANVSEIEAPFHLADRPASEMMAEIREKLNGITGAVIEIGQPISHRIDAMLSGTQANIAIKLFGEDLNRMYALGNQIKNEIAGIDGIADLKVEQQIQRPEISIRPRPDLLAMHGITLPEFNDFVSVMIGGETVGRIYEGNFGFDLVVRADERSRMTTGDIGALLIDCADGRKVPLADVAEIRSVAAPNAINRENAVRKIVISANAEGRDVGSVVDDIRSRIDSSITLPQGYHIEYGGQFESEREASRILLLASLGSIIAIFLLLYMQFRNLRESAVVLLNLPFALIGGVLVLRFTSGVVSIPAIIGFISLFGVATRNGMLLISRYNTLRSVDHRSVAYSVIKGSTDRLNPILMTALTSALALIPLAARGDLPGNEIQSPMAVVILGGLISSTFLNGFIIPIMYSWLHSRKSSETDK